MRARCGAVALWIPKTTPSVFAAGTAKNGCRDKKWGEVIPSGWEGRIKKLGEFFFFAKGKEKGGTPGLVVFFCLGGRIKTGVILLPTLTMHCYV